MPLSKKQSRIYSVLLAAASVSLVPTPHCLAQQLSPLLPLPAAESTEVIQPMARAMDKTNAQSFWATPKKDDSAPVVTTPRRLGRMSRYLNPLKPIVNPGAPVVKLAPRPGQARVLSKSAADILVYHLASKGVESIAADDQSIKQSVTAKASAVESIQPPKKHKEPTPVRPQLESAEQPQIAEQPKIAEHPKSVTQPLNVVTPSNPLTFLGTSVATAKNAVAVTSDFELAAATPSVVVRSPFVQPGNPNRYLFVIENIGSVDAMGTRVDLRVPAGVVLKQVVAESASSTARHALVRIEELKAGEKAIVEIEVQPTDNVVTFETSLRLETKRNFHGVTLPHSTTASAIPSSAAVAKAANSTTQTSFQTTGPVSSPLTAGIDGKLSASFDGPVLLPAGQTGDFSVTVKNPSSKLATNMVVQLKIPAGLKITVLDREAWISEAKDKISWEIKELGGGMSETIKYKAIGKSSGQQCQKITLGMEEVYQGDVKLVTLVSP